jgi:hypothetical protein
MSPSLWSLPLDASHLFDPPDSVVILATTPTTPSRLARLQRAFKIFSPKHKMLVISGAGPLQEEGVKHWCEGFGEVSQMRHMPNGDLWVKFRKEEVADTVCRLQATVFIREVGSVSLSWFSGRK